ncbi:MAG: 30S ribosome-binding factor RbfA [Candidatus Limnocylindrales bacterium]
MTDRTARLDRLLQEEISRILARELHDPRIGFATITRVETSPDLHHARVWVSLVGQPDERRDAFRALGRAMPFVRHELGALRLRRIPELHLELDDSVERGTRVLRILDDLEAGREPEPATPGETLPSPGPARSLTDEQEAAARPATSTGPRAAGGPARARNPRARGTRAGGSSRARGGPGRGPRG